MDVNLSFNKKLRQLFEPYRYKLIHGGRASGKSWAVAQALIVKAMQKKTKILCARQYQKSIKESSKTLIEEQIIVMGLEKYFKFTLDQIVCTLNGSRFFFAGLWHDPQKIKSTEGVNLCWVEEANMVGKDGLDILIPTIRVEGSEIWFTMNRQSEHDPVDQMFLGPAPPPDSLIININYDDNPFFQEVLRSQVEYDKQYNPDAYAHVWLGQPVRLTEAMILRNWQIRPDIEPDSNKTPLYYGADWGFSVDPMAVIRCWVNDERRELYVDYEGYSIGVDVDDTPAFFDKIPGSRSWIITADSARPEMISYMKKAGFRMRHSAKGKDSVIEGLKFLQNYRIVVHPRCKNLINELTLYQYKTDKKTGDIMPIPEDKNNHLIDALRYALERYRKSSKIMVG